MRRDTRCTPWVIHHCSYILILYSTVTDCDKVIQSSYRGCMDVTVRPPVLACAAVQSHEQRACMEGVTSALNKSAI